MCGQEYFIHAVTFYIGSSTQNVTDVVVARYCDRVLYRWNCSCEVSVSVRHYHLVPCACGANPHGILCVPAQSCWAELGPSTPNPFPVTSANY